MRRRLAEQPRVQGDMPCHRLHVFGAWQARSSSPVAPGLSGHTPAAGGKQTGPTLLSLPSCRGSDRAQRGSETFVSGFGWVLGTYRGTATNIQGCPRPRGRLGPWSHGKLSAGLRAAGGNGDDGVEGAALRILLSSPLCFSSPPRLALPEPAVRPPTKGFKAIIKSFMLEKQGSPRWACLPRSLCWEGRYSAGAGAGCSGPGPGAWEWAEPLAGLWEAGWGAASSPRQWHRGVWLGHRTSSCWDMARPVGSISVLQQGPDLGAAALLSSTASLLPWASRSAPGSGGERLGQHPAGASWPAGPCCRVPGSG